VTPLNGRGEGAERSGRLAGPSEQWDAEQDGLRRAQFLKIQLEAIERHNERPAALSIATRPV
jgi:hypothetical protein